MASFSADELSPLMNGFTIDKGPPKAITVASASSLADLRDVTVTGTLLKKQLVRLDPQTGERTARLAASNGRYKLEQDGDLHFCLGTEQLQPHIPCELQNAQNFISTFRDAVGGEITATGFFRCLFEHPGFRTNDDAHVFEIHPIRAVNINGSALTFDVDVPDQDSIHTWTDPHPLNDQDDRIEVEYDSDQDTLTFHGMAGQDENYVQVSGKVSDTVLNLDSTEPARFTFKSSDIGHPVTVYCMQGTSAAHQLRDLTRTTVSMVALRNIDWSEALNGRYVIGLLAIDIQPG
jgi:uncharacterized protein YdeI (BOF family)